jgi:hypothetical protein
MRRVMMNRAVHAGMVLASLAAVWVAGGAPIWGGG